MFLKKLNNFFGYVHFIVGAFKAIFSIIVLIQIVSNINLIISGSETNFSDYSILSIILGMSQLILVPVSIIMIIANIKNKPAVIPGYLLGLLALILEFSTPTMLYLFVLFAECAMYMKAGNIIINNNTGKEKNIKNTKDEEWFYKE